jgi:hypothetical protein
MAPISLRWAVNLILLLGAASSAAAQDRTTAASPQEVMRDYIDLYSGSTLDRWKTLFHPALRVADPDPDGGIRLRSLDEFFAVQKARFEQGHRISERLENVRIESGRRIASVTADFVFSEDGSERRGKLGLHLTQGPDGWRILALIFSYDRP